MSTTTKYVTDDELLRMSDDGYRYELIEGELRQMPPTGYEHGRVTVRFTKRLVDHVDAHGLGDVLAAETGFVVGRTPDGRVTVLAPDVAFVAKGRVLPGTDTSKYVDLAPDLVVETLSPNDTAAEVEEKIESWLRAGVRVAVTTNPASRSVTVYRSALDVATLTYKDELDLSDVVPGFRCRVAEIFT